jgi:hypothetical protein
MYLDEPGVIYRDGAPAGSTTTITNSANGVGNHIVVDNGGSPGVTILRNVRNGVGNSVTVTPEGPVIDLTPKNLAPRPGAAPTRPAVEYKGRGTKFWTKKVFSTAYGCNLFWCPKTRWWFAYDKSTDTYKPVSEAYDPASERK